jgi:endo-1,4-beta-D-glucanase Y
MGGPFLFPQNRVSGACTLTTAANASGSAQAAYNIWKNSFVTPAGAGGFLRVRWPTDASPNQDGTVSEGIGYGMLAAVYMNDRMTFDGLLNYAYLHRDAKGLMNWHITAGGAIATNSQGVVTGAGSASDGDEDIIWALIMASNQWSSTPYLDAARTMIDAMLVNSIAGDGMLKPGDNWGGTQNTYPDYFAPAYFRVFAVVGNNRNWATAIIDRNYAILAMVSGNNGLVPDATNQQYQIVGNYGYDACRTPWRIAMDYCFNDEPRAKAYLMKVGAFFDRIGAANIGDGYNPMTGAQTSGNKNMAFIGPAGVAGMAGFPKLLNDAFAYGAGGSGDQSYFPSSLRVVTMLMMSGNFLDYTKP